MALSNKLRLHPLPWLTVGALLTASCYEGEPRPATFRAADADAAVASPRVPDASPSVSKPPGDSSEDGGIDGSAVDVDDAEDAGAVPDGGGTGGKDACTPTGACPVECGMSTDECGDPVDCGECLPGQDCKDGSCVAVCDGCRIAGTCYDDGDENPANPCSWCDVGTSTSAWSDNDGAECADGLACTINDVCNAGTCEGELIDCGEGKICDLEEDSCVDQEPPTILSITPNNGSVGVLTTQTIVIEFSEPMNREATASAYSTASAGGLVGFEWTEDSKAVTIHHGLSYQDSPFLHAFSITTSATDVAGNPLRDDVQSSFTLAKALDKVVTVRDNRNWRPGVTGAYSYILAGDETDTGITRGFFAYDLGEPTGEVIGVQSAVMRTNIRDIIGQPFDVLGDLAVQHAEYVFSNTPTAAMYYSPVFESHILIAADAEAPAIGDEVTLDLTSSFERSWEMGLTKVQFIFGFFNPSTNGDGIRDSCNIGNNVNELDENYNRVEVRWLCADDCTP